LSEKYTAARMDDNAYTNRNDPIWRSRPLGWPRIMFLNDLKLHVDWSGMAQNWPPGDCWLQMALWANLSQNHSHILRAAINRPPADWRRRAGRPRWTWLRTIEVDL